MAAVEFGNEINTSGYNGDIPKPGSGRVLGISDLNNHKDTEGAAVASSLRVYLQLMARTVLQLDQPEDPDALSLGPAGEVDALAVGGEPRADVMDPGGVQLGEDSVLLRGAQRTDRGVHADIASGV